MEERPKTKIFKSQLLKRINFHSINRNKTKQYTAFITKPLNYKICSNSPVVSDNLKILHISAVFIFGQN